MRQLGVMWGRHFGTFTTAELLQGSGWEHQSRVPDSENPGFALGRMYKPDTTEDHKLIRYHLPNHFLTRTFEDNERAASLSPSLLGIHILHRTLWGEPTSLPPPLSLPPRHKHRPSCRFATQTTSWLSHQDESSGLDGLPDQRPQSQDMFLCLVGYPLHLPLISAHCQARPLHKPQHFLTETGVTQSSSWVWMWCR